MMVSDSAGKYGEIIQSPVNIDKFQGSVRTNDQSGTLFICDGHAGAERIVARPQNNKAPVPDSEKVLYRPSVDGMSKTDRKLFALSQGKQQQYFSSLHRRQLNSSENWKKRKK